MKKEINYVLLLLLLLVSCINKSGNSSQIVEIEKKYQDSITALMSQLEQANQQIELLKFPADQRLNKAKTLMESGDLEKALSEIQQLKKIFPNSQEASSSGALVSKINEIKEEKRKEEERIKALGFKAIPEQTNNYKNRL